ncbi:MAG: hypothetical protein KAS72_04340 [Phycisphaerales bacterium]|nr:hypothetical protein [Phycisphaerales bacterium]
MIPRSVSTAIVLIATLAATACTTQTAPTPAATARPVHPWMHEAEDGAITLATSDPMQVMNVIAWALQNRRHDLLLDQVISEETKAEYRSVGRDPIEAVQWLVANEGDVYRMFNLIRGQRGSMRSIGPRRMRLRVDGQASEHLAVTMMDIVLENRSWRLAVIR